MCKVLHNSEKSLTFVTSEMKQKKITKKNYTIMKTTELYKEIKKVANDTTLENVFAYRINHDKRFYQIFLHSEPSDKVKAMCEKNGIGLNLQQYRHTIYFDKVWDYALYTQSTRRTYRTGQEQDCHYWELTGNVGLERMIDKNIRKKIDMSEYLKRVSLEELKKEL